MWIWDALAFLFVAFVLGSFAFWLLAYFMAETIRYLISGPSQQLRSVGTSILDERPAPKARNDARLPPLRKAA